MKYKIIIMKPAQKFILKQAKPQQERILKAINQLPDQGDIKPLSGHDGIYRLRIGDVRVIYTIENDILVVRVLFAGSRGDVYKSPF